MNHTKYDTQAQQDETMFHEWDEDKKLDKADTALVIFGAFCAFLAIGLMLAGKI